MPTEIRLTKPNNNNDNNNNNNNKLSNFRMIKLYYIILLL